MSNIKTVDFYCYPQGDLALPEQLIKLPAVCCGVETIVQRRFIQDGVGTDALSGCRTHMSTYVDIWQNFKVRQYGLLYGVTNPYGVNCTVCNWRNDLAVGNQSDGSYVCFKCRSGY